MPLATIPQAIEALKRGEMVILVDDEDRENEGDLIMAAERVTPEAINFMAKWGRGLICLTLTPDRLEQLQIPMMVQDNLAQFGTAFTVSIEAAHGVTTGISGPTRIPSPRQVTKCPARVTMTNGPVSESSSANATRSTASGSLSKLRMYCVSGVSLYSDIASST